MKKQNGITLIALVITIIVLLILAGVSIAMLTGENGILNKATNATVETRKAEIREAITLATSTIMADNVDPTTTTKTEISYATIAEQINKDNASAAAEANGTTGIKYTYAGKECNVTFGLKQNDDGVVVGADFTNFKVEEVTPSGTGS